MPHLISNGGGVFFRIAGAVSNARAPRLAAARFADGHGVDALLGRIAEIPPQNCVQHVGKRKPLTSDNNEGDQREREAYGQGTDTERM